MTLAIPTAVIFDMDGVLIDSEPLHERAQTIVFAENDLEVPERLFGEFKGQREEDVFRYVVSEFGRDGLDPAELVRRKHETYRELMTELRPIDGSIPFVRLLQERGLRLALTTSAIRRDQEFALEMLGMQSMFEVVVTSDDVIRPKPDPEPYRITVERLNLDAGDCLVIEDSLNGVRSAVGAGCKVAGITTSFGREALVDAGAHVVVDSFEELLEYVGRYNDRV